MAGGTLLLIKDYMNNIRPHLYHTDKPDEYLATRIKHMEADGRLVQKFTLNSDAMKIVSEKGLDNFVSGLKYTITDN